MEVKKRDLEEIFKNKTFDIPRYQRGYDWKKLNLDIFWNDLSYHVKHSQTLFLGTIILNDNDRKQEVHNGCFNHSIVDGQQRFTTITILFVALREALRIREESEQDQRLKKRLRRTIEGIAEKFLAVLDNNYDLIRRPRLYGSTYKSKQIKNGLAYVTDPDWEGEFPKEAVEVNGESRKLTMEFNRFKQVYSDFTHKLNEKNNNGDFMLDRDYLLKTYTTLTTAEFIEIVVSNDNEAIT